MTEQTYNLTKTECLKEIGNFGSTIVKNICDGGETVIKWGHLEWVTAGFVALILVFLVTLMFAVIVSLIRDYYF